MSRTLEDIQREYNEAAIRLGAESFNLHILNEELERLEGNAMNLKRKMNGLVKESNKLKQVQDKLNPLPANQPKGEPVELAAQDGGPQSSVGETNEQA